MTNNNPVIPDVPFHPGPVYRPPPKPIKHDTSIQQISHSLSSIEDINPNINLDQIKYVGPVVINKIVDPHNYLL